MRIYNFIFLFDRQPIKQYIEEPKFCSIKFIRCELISIFACTQIMQTVAKCIYWKVINRGKRCRLPFFLYLEFVIHIILEISVDVTCYKC